MAGNYSITRQHSSKLLKLVYQRWKFALEQKFIRATGDGKTSVELRATPDSSPPGCTTVLQRPKLPGFFNMLNMSAITATTQANLAAADASTNLVVSVQKWDEALRGLVDDTPENPAWCVTLRDAAGLPPQVGR